MMRHLTQTAAVALALSFMCTALGCSRSASDPVPVVGRVFVDGKPATGATVVFHREGPPDNSAVKPIGKVDANGEFHLTTKEANDGASPGEYRVTVTWYVSAPIGKRSAEGDELPPRNLVPEKYTRYDATPLRATVSVEPTDPVTIEIKKK